MTAVRIQPNRVRSCTSCWNFGFATIRSYSDALCASGARTDPGPWTTDPAGFVAWGYGVLLMVLPSCENRPSTEAGLQSRSYLYRSCRQWCLPGTLDERPVLRP